MQVSIARVLNVCCSWLKVRRDSHLTLDSIFYLFFIFFIFILFFFPFESLWRIIPLLKAAAPPLVDADYYAALALSYQITSILESYGTTIEEDDELLALSMNNSRAAGLDATRKHCITLRREEKQLLHFVREAALESVQIREALNATRRPLVSFMMNDAPLIFEQMHLLGRAAMIRWFVVFLVCSLSKWGIFYNILWGKAGKCDQQNEIIQPFLLVPAFLSLPFHCSFLRKTGTRLYRGWLTHAHPSGAFDIRYDDGDEEKKKKLLDIHF